jgi:hypothetical protein
MRIKTFIPIIFLLLYNFTTAQPPAFNITVNTPQSSGYYFFCPYKLTAFPSFPSGTQTEMILDSNGSVIYYKPVSFYFAGDFKQLSAGKMAHVFQNGYAIFDSTFNIIDTITTQNGILFDLHDLIKLPNGNYLLLGNEEVHMNLTSYNMFFHIGAPGHPNALVTCGVVQEIDSLDNVVFEWHSKDHFTFDDADEFFLNNPAVVDWTHMNSVDMDTDGNIIISSRHFNEITKISRTDSSVIWRMGGKRNQFTFINDSIQFRGQHDFRRLPNGHVTLFDNGRSNPLHPAIAKEYVLDEINMTAELIWYHMEADSIYSTSQGNVQRLDNGNTLISWGTLQNENAVFTVVTPNNNKVFEISFPDSLITYRAYNYDSLPWYYNSPGINCMTDSQQTVLIADSGYSSYLWSTGDTSQAIPVSGADTFFVYVPHGDGGFLRSFLYIIADSLNPCSNVEVAEILSEPVTVFPNPAQNRIIINRENNIERDIDIKLYDLAGRIVHEIKFSKNDKQHIINTEDLSSGIYFIHAENFIVRFIKE